MTTTLPSARPVVDRDAADRQRLLGAVLRHLRRPSSRRRSRRACRASCRLSRRIVGRVEGERDLGDPDSGRGRTTRPRSRAATRRTRRPRSRASRSTRSAEAPVHEYLASAAAASRQGQEGKRIAGRVLEQLRDRSRSAAENAPRLLRPSRRRARRTPSSSALSEAAMESSFSSAATCEPNGLPLWAFAALAASCASWCRVRIGLTSASSGSFESRVRERRLVSSASGRRRRAPGRSRAWLSLTAYQPLSRSR